MTTNELNLIHEIVYAIDAQDAVLANAGVNRGNPALITAKLLLADMERYARNQPPQNPAVPPHCGAAGS